MTKARILATMFMHLQVMAEPVETTRILKDSSTWVALELNEQSVFCTARGYGSVQLKVSVPALKWLAHFDHRVVGENLPCITGGTCSEALTPGSILDPNRKIVVAPIRIVLSQVLKIDDETNACETQLVENVMSSIRGKQFDHYRAGEWQSVPVEICRAEMGL